MVRIPAESHNIGFVEAMESKFVQLERLIQHCGTALSYHVFTDKVLSRSWGKYFYLILYSSCKSLFESSELKHVSPWVSPGSTVVDVGANVGFMSVFFSDAVGPQGSVLAVEPDPVALELLRFNLLRCNCSNVTVSPFALGNRNEKTVFYQNQSNRADGRLVLDTTMVTHRRELQIPVRTFSSIATEEKLANVSLIKIDTQGYEVRVLTGMQDWLSRAESKPVLFMECWPYGLRLAGDSIEMLLAKLQELEYSVSNQTQEQLTSLTHKDQYQNIVFHPDS